MEGVNDLLLMGGYLSNNKKVIDKKTSLEKRVANLTAITDIYDRVTGSQDVYYDLFDGTNDHSAGVIDTTKTKAAVPFVTGTTMLADKVDVSNALANWFKTGQEITIQDDVNKEYVTVTNGGIVEESAIYDHSTPTTVINATNTFISDFARPQVLSNGWIVCGVKQSSMNNWIGMYKSLDKGETWQLIGFIKGACSSFSIASKGTIVYVLYTDIGNTFVGFHKFDAATQSGDMGVVVVPDNNQTAFSGCSLAINDAGTELHACWTAKNSTYPNTFNIRYSKGIINNDGSVIFPQVNQLTTINTTGLEYAYARMIIKDEKPIILYRNSNYHDISCIRFNGVSWLSPINVYVGGTYNQYTISSCVTSDGTIHAVWYGYDSTDMAYPNIRYSKSTDGGATWSTMTKLTSGNLNGQQCPSITFDKDNNLYVMWYGASESSTKMQIKKIVYSNGSWGSVTELTSNTLNHAIYPSTCLNYQNFTDPICIYQDNEAGVTKFRGVFSITSMVPQLEVTPLQNSYKMNALVYRSLGELGTTELIENVSTTTYDRSTPTTVINSAYTTSASARPVMLSNGWIVTTTSDPTSNPDTIRFIVSKNNGSTWSELCYHTAMGNDTVAVSVVSKGTMVYVLGMYSANVVKLAKFDATTVSGDITITSATSTTSTISSNDTALGGCSLAINSEGTELHACWSSKNATYPNSFNIRYVKGTINADGSVTWGSVQQVTTANTTGTNYSSLCMVVKLDNNPFMTYTYSATGVNSILLRSWNGIAWATYNGIYDGGNYTQLSSSVCVTSDGVIHVVWVGLDSTDSSMYNIRYSKSTDSGITWSTMLKLTSGNTYNQFAPSITFDKDDNLHVVFRGVFQGIVYDQIRKITCINNSWGEIINFTTNTTASNNNPSTCINYQNFTDPICIYQDNQAGVVKFRGVFSITNTITKIENALKFSDGFNNITTYDNSVPSTVTASNYDTIGSGGRKLVKLDNGWLVACVYDTTGYVTYFYKSTDNGLTWSQLCYLNGARTSGTAITSFGTTVYFLGTNASATCIFFSFDAVTTTNRDYSTGTSTLVVMDSQTSFGSGCSIAADSNGKLWAVWCSRNATYPNSFNIRISSSTDKGITWATPTQLTTTNTSGYENQYPTIVIKKDNNPVVIWSWILSVSSSTCSVYAKTYNGSSWGSIIYVTPNSSYNQLNPCAVVDNDGAIHVVWYGTDATDTIAGNIKYSKSIDSGATFSATVKLTSGNAYNNNVPSITCDSNNSIYVVWDSNGSDLGTYHRIRMRKLSAGTWGDIITLTTNTKQHCSSASTCENYRDFIEPLFIYKDNESVGVKFRGVWQDKTIIPLLSEDIRYNIVPSLGDTAEIVSWVQYENNTDFSADGKLSIVANEANEDFQSPVKTTSIINSNIKEDQYVYNSLRNGKVSQRITITRNNTSIDKGIVKLLGALGE